MQIERKLKRPIVALKGGLKGWAFSRSHGRSKLSCSLPRGPSWHANMVREVTVIVMPLFKLKIWETLGKPCPLINYYQAIDSNRTIENTDQVFRSFYKLCL